jgi:ParB-like chromosome segregation protein Spo0J
MRELPRSLPVKRLLTMETRFPLDLLWKDEKEYLELLMKDARVRGITDPVIIRVRAGGSLVIWDGLHRLAVAKELNIEELPVTFIGEVEQLSEEL